jgi:hypothetical protein
MSRNKKEKTHEEIEENKRINQYKLTLNKFILTSRFNNNTEEQNRQYRNKNKIECIYCSPIQVSQTIPIDAISFVIEMNNEINKIIGIGLIRNHPTLGKHIVYKESNYNRYVYTGKNRIDRKEMDEYEEQIMKALDILCFKGTTNIKRSNGLKQFPIVMQYKMLNIINLVEFISTMFKKRIQKTSTIRQIK